MMLWLLLFISLVWADESVVEKYCFPSLSSMNKARSRLEAIRVPSDRVIKDDNCLVVTMRPHRRELIQSYLRSGDPDFSITYSSEEIRREPCRLKIEKVKNFAREDLTGQAGKNSEISSTTTNGKGNEVFQVQTLKDFELSVDQDSIQGECRFITPQRYQIKLTVKKEAKPIIPPVPPGTIVIVNTPPPDQKTMLLETQLQLHKGERVEVGSIVTELKNKSHEVNSSPEVKGEKAKALSTEKVFLSID